MHFDTEAQRQKNFEHCAQAQREVTATLYNKLLSKMNIADKTDIRQHFALYEKSLARGKYLKN